VIGEPFHHADLLRALAWKHECDRHRSTFHRVREAGFMLARAPRRRGSFVMLTSARTPSPT
jgi:hypothetical protein